MPCSSGAQTPCLLILSREFVAHEVSVGFAKEMVRLRHHLKRDVACKCAIRRDYLNVSGGSAGWNLGVNHGRRIVEDRGRWAIECDAGNAFQPVSDNRDDPADDADGRTWLYKRYLSRRKAEYCAGTVSAAYPRYPVEHSISALDQSVRPFSIGAIHLRTKAVKLRERTSRTNLKHCAAAVGSAGVSCSIEIAISPEDQPSHRRFTIHTTWLRTELINRRHTSARRYSKNRSAPP